MKKMSTKFVSLAILQIIPQLKLLVSLQIKKWIALFFRYLVLTFVISHLSGCFDTSKSNGYLKNLTVSAPFTFNEEGVKLSQAEANFTVSVNQDTDSIGLTATRTGDEIKIYLAVADTYQTSVFDESTLIASGVENIVQLNPLPALQTIIYIKSELKNNNDTGLYKITVTRAKPIESDATLSMISITSGDNSRELSPSFARGSYNYSVSVGNFDESVNFTVAAVGESTRIFINDVAAQLGIANSLMLNALPETATNVVIKAVSADGSDIKKYNVTVNRDLSQDISILSLSMSAVISSGTRRISYEGIPTASDPVTAIVVPYSASALSLRILLNDLQASYSINGNTLILGSAGALRDDVIVLEDVGSDYNAFLQKIKILVVAVDTPYTQEYTVEISRAAPNNDAALLNLDHIYSGVYYSEMSPKFSSGTFNYTASVPYHVDDLLITAKLKDTAATLTINGVSMKSGEISDRLNIAVGDNLFTFDVLAEDKVTKSHYELTVKRGLPSEVALLKSLKLTSGNIQPYFSSSTVNYRASVPYGVDQIAIITEPSNQYSTIKINGLDIEVDEYGRARGVVDINEGETSIDIEVQSQSGNKSLVYTLVVIKPTATSFIQTSYIKASNTEAHDFFGFSVALSGNTLVVGAYAEKSASVAINGDQDDNSQEGAGAVYVFVRNSNGVWQQEAYLKPSIAGRNGFGTSLAIYGNTVAVGSPFESSNASGVNSSIAATPLASSGAVFVFTRTGSIWTQQAHIKASNPGAIDLFGGSVSLHNNTLVVGASAERSIAQGVNGDQTDNSLENAGAVYVFNRNNNVWQQQAYIKASNTVKSLTPLNYARIEGDRFGTSVSVFNDMLAVSATRESSNAKGINGDEYDNSAENSGAVYIFKRDSGQLWTQQAYIKASNTVAGSAFGSQVSLSNTSLAVGSAFESGTGRGVGANQSTVEDNTSGAVYLFSLVESFEGELVSESWQQQVYIKSPNSDRSDRFGSGLQLKDDVLLVGSGSESSNATGINGNKFDNSAEKSGAAYLYTRNSLNEWQFRTYIKASNTDASDLFGSSLTLSGDLMVIGANKEESNATGVGGDQTDNSALWAGAAYAFGKIPTSRYRVAINKGGNGTGVVTGFLQGVLASSINCASLCEVEYDSGNVVTLQASPDAGSTFINWSGNAACESTEATITVVVDQNITCSAAFDIVGAGDY